jgi:hypothetical protein
MTTSAEATAAAMDAEREPGSDTTSAADGEKRTLPPVLSKAPPVAMVIFGASSTMGSA